MEPTWNYRIVRYRHGRELGLHEVHYDEQGRPWAMTQDPIVFVVEADEGPETIVKALEMAMADARRWPVFDEPADGEWPGKEPG